MFTTTITLALAAVAAVRAIPLAPRGDAPVYRACDYLEDYDVYNTRYVALGCASQQHTDFYNECCNPLHKTESLSDKPAYCTPAPPPTSSDVPVNGAAAPSEAPAPPPEPQPSVPPVEAPASSDIPAPPAPSNVDVPPAPVPSSPPAPAPAPPPVPGPVGEVFSDGFATWFLQEGRPGACGEYHSDDDLIAAMSDHRFGTDYSQKSPECGKRVHITNKANGNTVEVVIVDSCPTCKNGNSIDLAKGAFSRLASPDAGLLEIDWYYL